MFCIYGNIHSLHLTLMAYSPFAVMPTFPAIMELLTSLMYSLPCQVLVLLLAPQAGQVSPSENNLQRLHASFLAILLFLWGF